MKKLLLWCTCVVAVHFLQAQTPHLLFENFNNPQGALLRENGWFPHSAANTNPLTTHAVGLSIANTPYIGNGIGRSAIVNNTGADENRPFSNYIDTGTVYTAFLMRTGGPATANGAGYFFHLVEYSDIANPVFTSISSAFRARTYITPGSSASKFRVGLTFNSATAPSEVGVDVSNDLDTGTTYLVVVKYQFLPGADNDQVSLFLFNPGDNIETEPQTPTLGPYGGTAPDANSLMGVALRQYSAEQSIIVDGICARTNWNFSTTTRVADKQFAASLNVYPNPVQGGKLIIDSPEKFAMQVRLTTVAGAEILQANIIDAPLNVAHLPSGLYLLHITQSGKSAVKKIIIP